MALNAKPVILWDNLVAYDGVYLTATSSASGHPVENITDWREYLYWQAGQSGAHIIQADLGAVKDVSAFCMYGHTFKTAGISSITFYGSNNGADWTEIFTQTISSDLPVIKIISPVSYRYFKLSFTVGDITPQIALLFIGSYLEFPIWLSEGFDPNQEEINIESAESQEGYLLGVIENYRHRRLSLEFRYIQDSWVRNYFIPFWRNHIPKPFLFSWDYLNHPKEIYLVRVSEPRLDVPYEPVYRSLRLELEGRAE